MTVPKTEEMGKLRIVSLGGVDEIGKNMTVFEYGDDIIVVDCGSVFPKEDMLGVDLVIPDVSYLLSRKDHLRGFLFTHGHEDHIGALPWLLVQYKNLRGLNIYGSPFTLALVEHKLEEHGMLDRVCLVPVHPYDEVRLGDMTFCFIPVCHSIPQSYALCVRTPAGNVIHTGDFKLDSLPIEGDHCDPCRDFRAFAQGGDQQGVRLLLADSTNIEIRGRSLPESSVRDGLDAIFSGVRGRIVIALFSSHIRRIRTVFELAEKYGRSIFISGRSLLTNIDKATELGLLAATPNIYSEYTGLPGLDPQKTVVLATGTQGEPLSALARIARGEYRHVTLGKGDPVIMSSRVIPGNARALARVLDQIYRLGADVYHGDDHVVHATGHACREELQQVITAVKPEYFVPVHGEYRHLALHARLAEECGVNPSHIHVIEDGQPLSLGDDGLRLDSPIAAESVMVDGKGVGDVGRVVLKERRILGGEGMVAVILVIADETGEVLLGPEMISRGFVFEQQYSHLLEDSKCLVLDLLETITPGNAGQLSDGIRSVLRRFFRDLLGRDPVVLPIVLRV